MYIISIRSFVLAFIDLLFPAQRLRSSELVESMQHFDAVIFIQHSSRNIILRRISEANVLGNDSSSVRHSELAGIQKWV